MTLVSCREVCLRSEYRDFTGADTRLATRAAGPYVTQKGGSRFEAVYVNSPEFSAGITVIRVENYNAAHLLETKLESW